LDLTKET